MKKTLLALVAGTLFFACNRATETTQTTRTSAADEKPVTLSPDGEMCFRQVSGGQNRDTAWLHLNIKNAKVSGTYWYLPFEKET